MVALMPLAPHLTSLAAPGLAALVSAPTVDLGTLLPAAVLVPLALWLVSLLADEPATTRPSRHTDGA